MNRAALTLAGLAATALAVAALVLSPGGALFGWLAAFAFWAGVPIGALFLLILMRIVPGPWSAALAPEAAVAALLMPLVVLAALPVAFGHAALYPWTHADPETAFRARYLAPGPALVRSGIFLVGGCAAAMGLALPWRGVRPLAVAALPLFVPLHTLIAFDWLMALDPAFHASGFGLYVLSIQTTSALAALILLHPSQGRRGPLGALLLTALLLWFYFAYMQYLIVWSDNLPPGAAWYLRRTSGAWSAVFPAVVLLHAVPTLLLIFPPLRARRTALAGCAGLVLVGKALETAWLVLPAGPGGALAIGACLLALFGLGALGLAAAASLADRLDAAGLHPAVGP